MKRNTLTIDDLTQKISHGLTYGINKINSMNSFEFKFGKPIVKICFRKAKKFALKLKNHTLRTAPIFSTRLHKMISFYYL